jgi:hypothetical protein
MAYPSLYSGSVERSFYITVFIVELRSLSRLIFLCYIYVRLCTLDTVLQQKKFWQSRQNNLEHFKSMFMKYF